MIEMEGSWKICAQIKKLQQEFKVWVPSSVQRRCLSDGPNARRLQSFYFEDRASGFGQIPYLKAHATPFSEVPNFVPETGCPKKGA